MSESFREFARRCQKPDHKTVGNWMVRKILRPAALPVTWLLVKTPVTAHQVTAAAFVAAALAAFWLALPGAGNFLAGALTLQLWYYLDHVDGQVARYRRAISMSGRFLDFLMHHVVHSLVVFALSHYAYRHSGNPFYLVWGFLASTAITQFNLIHDIRSKVFVERLTRGDKAYPPECLPAAEPGPGTAPAPAPSTGRLKTLFSWAHKSCEIHVMMNALTAAALIERFLAPNAALRWGLFWFYGMILPVVSLVKIVHLLRSSKIDEEYREFIRALGGPHEKK